MLGGEIVADSVGPLLVWEVPYYPTYFFPTVEVATDRLTESGESGGSTQLGQTTRYAVKVGDREGAAYAYLDGPSDLSGSVAFVWETMDHWFEEDEEVYTHARSPYTRVDILGSNRRVRVDIDGVTVADSTNARFLLETGLPTRYYHPKTDVEMTMVHPPTSPRTVPTRARPATGPSPSTARLTRMSHGVTTPHSPSRTGSRGWCASTTRESTCS